MAINIAKAMEGSFYPFQEIIEVSSSVLDGRLAKFVTPCVVTGQFVTEGDYVHIDGTCEFSVLFQCDRCLADVIKEFKIGYSGSYYLEGTEVLEGYRPYFNGVVDITDGVEEEILLSLPSRVLCKDDCKGLCHSCGADLNKGDCGCEAQSGENPTSLSNNPFAALLDLKNSTGGVSNGSTKG